jgi:hypothetical protein
MRLRLVGAMVGALACVLLNGCGVTGSEVASTVTTSPGTNAGGPVSIATDHAHYAPNAVIYVTVTNHTSASIYAYDTQASCSILSLEVRQSDGSFAGASVARCPLGRPARPVTIASGGVYSASIQAGFPGLINTTFPAGTYRLALTYGPSAAATLRGKGTTIYSATFTVAD